MKRTVLTWLAMATLSLTNHGFAESANTATSTTAAIIAPSVSKPMASIDSRPSWTSLSGEFHTENSVLAGYKFNDTLSSYGVFNFNTNIYSPGADLGVDPKVIDFSLRAKLANLYKHEPTGISFSYETRAYLPVTTASQDKGMITAIRNYFVLSKAITPSLKLSLYDVPIFHVYQRAGSITKAGTAAANPWFENRIYLVGSYQITKDLNFALPVYFHMTRFRDFAAGAAKNDSWDYLLYTYPELAYSINENLTVGAAYYSDNLIAADLSGTNLSAGLEKGVFQVFAAASL